MTVRVEMVCKPLACQKGKLMAALFVALLERPDAKSLLDAELRMLERVDWQSY